MTRDRGSLQHHGLLEWLGSYKVPRAVVLH
jgi:hypothetical protein